MKDDTKHLWARVRMLVRLHPLASFVSLAYGLSWTAWAPLVVRGAHVVPGGSVSQFPGLLGPALAALIVRGLTLGREGVHGLLRSSVTLSGHPVRIVVYGLSPLGFLALSLALMRATGRPMPAARDFALYPGVPIWPLPGLLLAVFVMNGYGEEIGWRGFALQRFQKRFGPIPGTLLLGGTWAAWHAPLFRAVDAYRAMGPATIVFGFGLGIAAGAIVLARVMNRTGGSVLAVALWHTTYNVTSATAAGQGFVGGMATMCVMVWAMLLLVLEWIRPLSSSRLEVG